MNKYKYPLSTSTWGNEELEAIERVTKSGKFTMGDEVRKFENMFSNYIGSKYSVMVNSGSSANLLMIAAHILPHCTTKKIVIHHIRYKNLFGHTLKSKNTLMSR